MTLENERANEMYLHLRGSIEGPLEVCDHEFKLRFISMNEFF